MAQVVKTRTGHGYGCGYRLSDPQNPHVPLLWVQCVCCLLLVIEYINTCAMTQMDQQLDNLSGPVTKLCGIRWNDVRGHYLLGMV
jgi:hypothetical protein